MCAVKLDMHKAYDRVQWSYLKSIMLKMGFEQRWVRLIMECVSSVDVETDTIKPIRGLWQGDPVSPYLFLLVAEGLLSMLKGAEDRGEIEGVKVCRGALVVSHLLFADDSLILMHADKKNEENLQSILNEYCVSSGQKLSKAKSSIYFSGNTPVEVKAEV